MAKKKKTAASAAQGASRSEAVPPSGLGDSVNHPEQDTAASEAADERLREEMSEMKELTRALIAEVREVRAQSTRTEMVRNAIQDVKADVQAASHAMLMAHPTAAPYANATGEEQRGKCGPCECVSDGCCCFDIIVAWVRAAKPQIEPADMGDLPGVINALEVQIYVTVNGIGFLLPGLGSTMDLRADGFPGGPGPKVCVERAVNRICLPKGSTLNVVFEGEVREHDEGIERPIGLKDEVGQGQGSITLNCCMDKIYPPAPVDVPLIYGGEGKGLVQIGFYAQRVCC